MSAGPPLLELDCIRFGYGKGPVFLGPISLAIERGQLWGIVGPNGAGKSTLVRLMAGLLAPVEGQCRLLGTPLPALSARRRARMIGFLPQTQADFIDYSVHETVLMGRYPHRSFGLFESAEDYRIAEGAMRRTRVFEFADRAVGDLSGGEVQRVHLAAVLAQQPDLLLLDEPTASLDLKHQLEVFTILQDLRSPDGPGIVVITHDINLAASRCSHLLILHAGKIVAAGPPNDVATAERLSAVYEVTLETVHAGGAQRPWLVPVHTGQVADAGLPP